MTQLMLLLYKNIDVGCVKLSDVLRIFHAMSRSVGKTDVLETYGALFQSPDLCTKIRGKNN